MNLPTFPQPRQRQREPETEKKLQLIIKRSGIITFDDVEYKTELKDLEDLGELGNGTSGHVFKMRHKPTNKVIAVKVRIFIRIFLHRTQKLKNYFVFFFQQMRRTNNQEEEKRIIMDIDVVLKSHDCPYIVHCIGCFITDAEVWICMELMSTCFDKLTKKSRQSVPEAILGKITVAVSAHILLLNWVEMNSRTHRLIETVHFSNRTFLHLFKRSQACLRVLESSQEFSCLLESSQTFKRSNAIQNSNFIFILIFALLFCRR